MPSFHMENFCPQIYDYPEVADKEGTPQAGCRRHRPKDDPTTLLDTRETDKSPYVIIM